MKRIGITVLIFSAIALLVGAEIYVKKHTNSLPDEILKCHIVSINNMYGQQQIILRTPAGINVPLYYYHNHDSKEICNCPCHKRIKE